MSVSRSGYKKKQQSNEIKITRSCLFISISMQLQGSPGFGLANSCLMLVTLIAIILLLLASSPCGQSTVYGPTSKYTCMSVS